jgi:hypothetical protein
MGIPPVRLLDKVRKTSPACQQYSEGDSKSCKIVRNYQACGLSYDASNGRYAIFGQCSEIIEKILTRGI